MAKSKGRRAQPPRRKGPTPRKRRVEPGAARAEKPNAGEQMAPAASSSRYTPPAKNRGMFRPVWHKVIGGLVVLAGLAIFVVNDLEWLGIHLMPGGHNELYAVAGIVVAGSSMWWFGWLDRSHTRW